MKTPAEKQEGHGPELVGRAALIASIGGQRGWADWANPEHRLRRLLAEFIGMAGLTFVLSGGAAILVRYGGRPRVRSLWRVHDAPSLGPDGRSAEPPRSAPSAGSY